MTARVLVGVIGAPIGILLIWLGHMPMAVAVMLISGVGAWEYGMLCRTKAWAPSMPVLIGGAALFVLDAAAWGGEFTGPIIAAILLASLAFQILRGRPANAVVGPALEVFGALYCGWTMSRYYLIRSSFGPAGFGLSLLTIILVWMNDMGAYFTGMALGRRKLAPLLSPKKTVEGSVGGFAWAVCGTVAFKLLGDATNLWYTLSWPVAIAFAFLVAACGQLGDLAESAMKRDAGVKDAGWILPGHGGVLDRFDSLFFVSPVAYYFLSLIMRHMLGS